VPIVIKVKADKDSADVRISMSLDPGVTIEDETDKTGYTHKDKVLIAWKKPEGRDRNNNYPKCSF
jgi:hypothetical protein